MSKFRGSKNLKASLMSFTCTLFSDKGRCFDQSERALYGNFVIIKNETDLHVCRVGVRGGQLAIYLISKIYIGSNGSDVR